MIFKYIGLIFVIDVLFLAIVKPNRALKHKFYSHRTTVKVNTKSMCLQINNSLRALHKSCFLRPDTGPCRADIVQWYFDIKLRRCFRFFWGGCQGNGNRFATNEECHDYCYLNISAIKTPRPHFCDLAFDYGSCFGLYNRWAWDKFSKSCKLRLYSGCGGNQNNFQSQDECVKTCLGTPRNTYNITEKGLTTCVPVSLDYNH